MWNCLFGIFLFVCVFFVLDSLYDRKYRNLVRVSFNVYCCNCFLNFFLILCYRWGSKATHNHTWCYWIRGAAEVWCWRCSSQAEATVEGQRWKCSFCRGPSGLRKRRPLQRHPLHYCDPNQNQLLPLCSWTGGLVPSDWSRDQFVRWESPQSWLCSLDLKFQSF